MGFSLIGVAKRLFGSRKAPQPPAAEELSHNEEILSKGEWVTLQSSWIDQIRWDWRSRACWMETKDGGLYRYDNVPIEVPLKWIESMSGGRFWWSFIVPVYSPAARIRKGTAQRKKAVPNVIRLVKR
jgi:hypothetical protein